jgi:oxygen-dependent protoporphyrinogen oxidase
MNSAAVIGAGITGLSAAWRLKARGVPVTVYEAGSRAGGVIRTVRQDGFIAECGPNTILESSPEIPAFFRELGLENDLLYSNPAARKKYIVRGGNLEQVPQTLAGFAFSKFFTLSAKLRLLREPFIPRLAREVDESIAAFVVRRLGREFLDYAIDPLVAGIYAGDPWKLSVREAFGKVHALEQRYGSLIRGQIFGAWDRKRRGMVSKQHARKLSFVNGLSTLTDTLSSRLKDELHCGYSLQRIEQTPSGWRLGFKTAARTVIVEHDAVLLALPACKLSSVQLISNSGRSFDFLSRISYAPVSSIVFGFRRDQVHHPLDGFGFLVPEAEYFNILGAIFSSTLFPNRAPKGHVCITCYMGGLRAPELPLSAPEDQAALGLADLRDVLEVYGEPVFKHCTVHRNAIPQYDIGHAAIREEMEALEESCPGLHLGGNYRGGVSLGDSILNGLAFGQKMADAMEIGSGQRVPLAAAA